MTAAERIEALAACRSSADVARLLRDAGAKGVRLKTRACPIARYVGESDDAGCGEVALNHVRAYDEMDEVVVHHEFCMTDPIGVFVDDFDAGEYSDLVEIDR